MTLEKHISEIKQELAIMTQEGHQSDFGIETCMGCISYECEKMLAINDRNEGRQNE